MKYDTDQESAEKNVETRRITVQKERIKVLKRESKNTNLSLIYLKLFSNKQL